LTTTGEIGYAVLAHRNMAMHNTLLEHRHIPHLRHSVCPYVIIGQYVS